MWNLIPIDHVLRTVVNVLLAFSIIVCRWDFYVVYNLRIFCKFIFFTSFIAGWILWSRYIIHITWKQPLIYSFHENLKLDAEKKWKMFIRFFFSPLLIFSIVYTACSIFILHNVTFRDIKKWKKKIIENYVK